MVIGVSGVQFGPWSYEWLTKSDLYNLQSQSLELVIIVIVISVVIGGFSGDDLNWLAHITVRLQVSDYSQLSHNSVRLQLCRLIRGNHSSLCFNHIWRNCNYYDYYSCSNVNLPRASRSSEFENTRDPLTLDLITITNCLVFLKNRRKNAKKNSVHAHSHELTCFAFFPNGF